MEGGVTSYIEICVDVSLALVDFFSFVYDWVVSFTLNKSMGWDFEAMV
jgi:hypothetical protein